MAKGLFVDSSDNEANVIQTLLPTINGWAARGRADSDVRT